MALQVVSFSPQQAKMHHQQILSVYQAAFAAPPYCAGDEDIASFSESLLRHIERDGFRCVVAQESADGRMLGFAYGYSSQAGQWWHDMVANVMSHEMIETWLDGAFELVTLAVEPSVQGKGIGDKLHDVLLSVLPHHAAVLSTRQVETNALRLYRKKGWEALLRDFFFPSGNEPWLVMGLDLSRHQFPEVDA